MTSVETFVLSVFVRRFHCPIEVAREHLVAELWQDCYGTGHFKSRTHFFEHIYRYMMASKHEGNRTKR